MRILLLHNRYQLPGGEDTVVRTEKKLLEAHNHAVSLLEFNNDGIVGGMQKLRAAADALYSLKGKQAVCEAIKEFHPDLVHVHNFFPLLSPAVFDACQEMGTPAVQTLHNYRLACPNAIFFRNGSPCEACLSEAFPWSGIMNGCYRGSRLQSAGTAAMIAFHRMRGTWKNKVNTYIALTNFQKQKMVEAGLPAHKIQIKSNFTFDPEFRREEGKPGSFGLFVGRISEEKGLQVLLEGYRQWNLNVPLKIAGGGPLLESLKASLPGGQVEFLGHQDKSAIQRLMADARFLVVPSIWYEGFPMTIIEAFSCGLPIICSDHGGLAEIVDGTTTGWRVPPGDADAWASTLEKIWSDPEDCLARGIAARKSYEQLYTPEVNYRRLMDIYAHTIAN